MFRRQFTTPHTHNDISAFPQPKQTKTEEIKRNDSKPKLGTLNKQIAKILRSRFRILEVQTTEREKRRLRERRN